MKLETLSSYETMSQGHLQAKWRNDGLTENVALVVDGNHYLAPLWKYERVLLKSELESRKNIFHDPGGLTGAPCGRKLDDLTPV